MRELKYPAIYKHFRNGYYATMGVSAPMSFDDINKFCIDTNTKAIKLLKFEASYTEAELNQSISIFELGGKWHHMKEECCNTLVLYKSLYDNAKPYARRYDMFLSKVDKKKYPNVKQEYRFEEVKKNEQMKLHLIDGGSVMNEISTISWIDVNKKEPLKRGWYIVVLKPVNHNEFTDNPSAMNDWISNFGINKLWWNNGSFWEEGYRVTERVICWAEIPKVPLYK